MRFLPVFTLDWPRLSLFATWTPAPACNPSPCCHVCLFQSFPTQPGCQRGLKMDIFPCHWPSRGLSLCAWLSPFLMSPPILLLHLITLPFLSSLHMLISSRCSDGPCLLLWNVLHFLSQRLPLSIPQISASIPCPWRDSPAGVPLELLPKTLHFSPLFPSTCIISS